MPFVKRQWSKFTKPTKKSFRNQSPWQKAVTVGRATGEIASDAATAATHNRLANSIRNRREKRKTAKQLKAEELARQAKNRAAIRKAAETGQFVETNANGEIVVKAHDRTTANGTVKVKQHTRSK